VVIKIHILYSIMLCSLQPGGKTEVLKLNAVFKKPNITTITCATSDDISIYDVTTITCATSHDVSIYDITTITCVTADDISIYAIITVAFDTSDDISFYSQ
jgi:hypothetical protein